MARVLPCWFKSNAATQGRLQSFRIECRIRVKSGQYFRSPEFGEQKFHHFYSQILLSGKS
jgi:hypothetical protein